jgi:hypothetical protein
VARLQREHARAEVDRRPRHGRAQGKETPIGWMPRYEDIDWKGLDFPREKFEELQQAFRPRRMGAEVIGHEELFIDLHDHLPPEMIYERELLICRFDSSSSGTQSITRSASRTASSIVETKATAGSAWVPGLSSCLIASRA